MAAPKTVLITGATRGIGLTLAEHYVRLGWKVIGAVRDPAAADKVRRLCDDHEGNKTQHSMHKHAQTSPCGDGDGTWTDCSGVDGGT
jgi:NAD(P)-dependent dehydrogenase (short-subunit alcohol dehydrogenase family)